MSSDLYREQLLEHYHNPENFGVLENADIDIEMDNPTCGDMIHLTARLDTEGRIAKVMFEGQGCVISMASSSMFTEAVVGKTPAEIAAMGLSEIQEIMGGVRLSMGRVKCALLPLNAMKLGLKEAGKL
ncbi:MAG TPA: SUF system NifU family Fe-S cluster assembly protein [Anaerolineae bacterium]|nr:SUF system NifU family Fe-S cluster assembly protein [Anaerolineae bacterium]HQK13950.1 SUF system NifU family Fe-S cluster assembly protein [Anaerolineae bacterium]